MQSAKLQLKIKNSLRWIKNNKLIVLILICAFLLRIYHLQELFYYSHDNDLSGWFIKDILVNHHPRLIGQETSTRGIFIGPLFYYLQIPFYILTGLDPIGSTLLVAILGTAAVGSIYFVFSKIWNRSTGFIGGLIYATSFYTILTDREVVPTMPVMLWTVWFLYALWLLLKNRQKWAWPIMGILLGLIWHLNFALVLVIPLIAIAFILSSNTKVNSDSNKELGIKNYEFRLGKKMLELKALVIGLLYCVILSIPLFLFELRHNFQQVRSLFKALSTNQEDPVTGIDKWIRTFHLASKDVTSLLGTSIFSISIELVHVGLLLLLVYLIWKKYIEQKLGIILVLWIGLFLSFFSLYSKILSEYYLNGMIVVYIAILAVGLSTLLSFPRRWEPNYLYGFRIKSGMTWKVFIGIIGLSLFVLINLYRLFTIPLNRSGYIYRKAIIAEIKKDALDHGYPCTSISYITDPGSNLGYRYFIWRANLKTKPITQTVPVYTIIFPLKPIYKEDIAIGALGLIYPDYSRYTSDAVSKACEGPDWNLEEPMFGFTE
jgi:4-amino-4-deoxy-L-arabinose transferase-like glycosyltransferase